MLNGIKIAQENENRKSGEEEWRYQKLGRENDSVYHLNIRLRYGRI